MPVRLSLLDRLAFYRFARAPAPLLDLFGAAGFRAVCLALDLGVFEALADGNRSPEAVAAAVDADPDGVRHLLDFLAALGYVRTSDGTYEPSESTRRWLLDPDNSLGPWLTYWGSVGFRFWDDNLEAAVREGEPPQTMYEWLDSSEDWERIQRGFRAVATLLVDDVLDAITVRNADRDLLDVGGGHAHYAIEACRRYPHLDATVVDRPGALDVAREDVAAADLTDRIDCVELDVTTDYLGESYDVAFLFNVAHGFDPAANRALFERVFEALAPGGRLAVLDQFEGDPPTRASKAALGFARFVYFSTLGADVYAMDDVADWLREAGFESVERTTFRTLPGIGLLEAEKPSHSE